MASQKQLDGNYLELKAVLLAPKEFQDLIVFVATDNTTVVSYINKEGGMRSGPLYALLWRILTLCTTRQVTPKVQHIPGPAECGSRQAIKARPDHPDRVVSPSGGLSINMHQVAQAADRPIYNEVQQQVAPVCVTGTGPSGLGSVHTQPAIGGSGLLYLATSSHLGQSGEEAAGSPLPQIHSDSPRVVKHALVLGSGGHVQPDPHESAQSAHPSNTALQSDSLQESAQPKSACLAPKSSALKE